VRAGVTSLLGWSASFPMWSSHHLDRGLAGADIPQRLLFLGGRYHRHHCGPFELSWVFFFFRFVYSAVRAVRWRSPGSMRYQLWRIRIEREG